MLLGNAFIFEHKPHKFLVRFLFNATVKINVLNFSIYIMYVVQSVVNSSMKISDSDSK